MQIGFGVVTLDVNDDTREVYNYPNPIFVDAGWEGFEGTSVFIENSMSF
jgi:hypothetical protein